MKLKKVRVPEFINTDDFGTFKAHDVEIMYDPSENEFTAESFDQERHSYFLSDEEVDRLTRESAQRFYDEHGTTLLRGTRKFKRKEVDAIKSFFKLSGAELGDLIGLDKSSISRILSSEGKQELQKDKAMLLLERLRDELEHPGRNRIVLSHLRDGVAHAKRCEQLCLPALKVADYFVRKFADSDGPVTHLKLQKLLYYAQGIGFGRANIKLIQEQFLAWEHGPVIREVYNHYRSHGNSPLPTNDTLNIEEVTTNDTVMAVLQETISLYGVYDAWFLRDKTHSEPPWADTQRDEVITDDKMMRFFKKVLV